MEQSKSIDVFSLAKEKGFEGLFVKEWKHSSKEFLRKQFLLYQIQKWLREIHNIHISVWYSKVEYNYNVSAYHGVDDNLDSEVSYFNNYEEALEIGVLEALKLIRNG